MTNTVSREDRYECVAHRYRFVDNPSEGSFTQGPRSWRDLCNADDEGIYPHEVYSHVEGNKKLCKIRDITFKKGDDKKRVLSWEEFVSLGKPKSILEKTVFEAVQE